MGEAREEALLTTTIRMTSVELGAVEVNVEFNDCERDDVAHKMTSAMYVPFAGAMSETELLETADSVSDCDYEMAPHFMARRGSQHHFYNGWLSFVIQDDDVVYMKRHPEWLEEVLACFAHKTIVTVKTSCDDAKTVFDQFRRELGRFNGTSGFIKPTK
jgi:hypothetical protein